MACPPSIACFFILADGRAPARGVSGGSQRAWDNEKIRTRDAERLQLILSSPAGCWQRARAPNAKPPSSLVPGAELPHLGKGFGLCEHHHTCFRDKIRNIYDTCHARSVYEGMIRILAKRIWICSVVSPQNSVNSIPRRLNAGRDRVPPLETPGFSQRA